MKSDLSTQVVSTRNLLASAEVFLLILWNHQMIAFAVNIFPVELIYGATRGLLVIFPFSLPVGGI